MKIASYVQTLYGKQTYATECYDVRGWVGITVIEDALHRAGYETIKAGRATAHEYDAILVYLTSDCDFWSFIAERLTWPKTDGKVIVGGPGVMNVRPFLPFFDIFVLGRGEDLIVPLIQAIEAREKFDHESIIYSEDFDPARSYRLMQTSKPYPHPVTLENGKTWREGSIGCPHKCFFCGYSWHRQHVGSGDFDTHDQNIIGMTTGTERAILDIGDGTGIDFTKLRVTAIDGLSERIRFSVNKHITNEHILNLWRLMDARGKPHQVKFFNIVGYPDETPEDWLEFINLLRDFDGPLAKQEKQWSILLHSTPFRSTPATPLAIAPMQYRDFRHRIARELGGGRYHGNYFYRGNKFWGVESMATESLPTVFLSALATRGTEEDTKNIQRLCGNRQFWKANTEVKLATLETLFDHNKLFGSFTWKTLPTAYLKTYANLGGDQDAKSSRKAKSSDKLG